MGVLSSLGLLDSFSDVIPNAAEQGDNYLAAINKAVQAQGLPVEVGLETATSSSGLFRSSQRQCLAVVPSGKRLRPFKTLHYATPLGRNLAIGWYLLGGEKLSGTQVGVFNFGGLGALDLSDLQAIVQCVHQFAVMPAIYKLADFVQYDKTQLVKKNAGFFGT